MAAHSEREIEWHLSSCPACGATNGVNAVTCWQCEASLASDTSARPFAQPAMDLVAGAGQDAGAEQAPQPPVPPARRTWPRWLAVSAVAAVGLIGVFAYVTTRPIPQPGVPLAASPPASAVPRSLPQPTPDEADRPVKAAVDPLSALGLATPAEAPASAGAPASAEAPASSGAGACGAAAALGLCDAVAPSGENHP